MKLVFYWAFFEVIFLIRESKEVLREVGLAILPITFFVTILQFFFLGLPLASLFRFLGGAFLVAAGLFLFLQGVRVGLLAMGEMVGAEMLEKGNIVTILLITFVLGVAITVAEPGVQVLAMNVDLVTGGELSSTLLLGVVGLSLGIFLAFAILRIFLGISMGYILAVGYAAIIIFSFFTPAHFVPIAFDAGGVTTGPMTVPFILSIGLGVTSVLPRRSEMGDTFGLMGLASLGPVLGVMLLGVLFQ